MNITSSPERGDGSIKDSTTLRTFYDRHAHELLEGFVAGNPRVDAAWETIRLWGPRAPSYIAEIGCGIGDICARMSENWPTASIVGVDISPRAIDLARRLFGSDRIRFHESRADELTVEGTFDLIAMIDTYEHIASPERDRLHESLRQMLSETGRIILSFPTPRHLEWLRMNAPDQIQPVDEDIDLGVVDRIAIETGTEVLLYKEISVWHEGDYAHAVLGRVEDWPLIDHIPASPSTRGRSPVWEAVVRRADALSTRVARAKRSRLVERRLGRNA